MAKMRKGGMVQSQIAMLLWGKQGTGKSTLALQSAYLKRPDGKPFRVLYIDAESGSVDDYMQTLADDGVNLDNILLIYSQSLAEIREYIRKATNNEPFYMLDDEGIETEEIILDADGEPFNPDMIVIDGTAILYMTSQQSLINFSKKRAAVRANKKELLGDERLVSVELAGMEQKDWGTLKFYGQDLVLDLTACGKHYIVTAREKAETESKTDSKGEIKSVATGRVIPDSFKDIAYNVKTEIHLYRNDNDPASVYADVIKDRTEVHRAGESIEDPSLLDWQSIITKTANNAKNIIKNNLVQASRVEEDLYVKDIEQIMNADAVHVGNELSVASEFSSPTSTAGSETVESIMSQVTALRDAMPLERKQRFKEALKARGLPTAFKSIRDPAVASEIRMVAETIE